MVVQRKNKFGDYDIAFKGLKVGRHVFEYELDNTFFELFDHPQVEAGKLSALVELQKSVNMLELSFEINGKVEALCDRCLGKMDVPVMYKGTLFVKFGETFDDPGDDILVIPYEEHSFNIAKHMYEFIVVSMPVRHVHPDIDGVSGCDPEMLKRLNQYVVDDVSNENKEEPLTDIDPRWNELKKLINKNNK